MLTINKYLIDQLEHYKLNEKWLIQESIPDSSKLPFEILEVAAKSFIHPDPETLNVDLIDLSTVLNVTGSGLISTAITKGPERALKGIKQVLIRTEEQKVLTKNCKIALLSVFSGPVADLELEELTLITEVLQSELGIETEVIFGHGIREDLEDRIQILVVLSANKEVVPELV